MANIISAQTGNWTAASTWQTVDSTSELDSDSSSTAISTSNLDSATFTPGAITVDGVALKLFGRATSPAGTFTVTLRNSTGGVDVTSVTVNVADLPASGRGWVFFRFSSSQLLLAATAYLIRVVCSNTGSQVTLLRNATANNWSRKLRTTTTQAPGANDIIVISNQFTGAGASTAVTVTMDNTATTTWGTFTGSPAQGVYVCGNGTLTWGTSASTNYYFRVRNVFEIAGGGTVNIGTTGTPIPSTSTAIVEFDCVSNSDSAIRVHSGGTLNIVGPTKNARTTLTNTVTAGATSLVVGSTSGWEAGDVLCFSPSGVSAGSGNYETRTILTVDSATTVTLTAGTANGYTVNSQLTCFIGNLTRRIKVRGISSSLNMNSIQTQGTGSIETCQYVETLNYTGQGFYANSTGNFNIRYCTVNTGSSVNGMYIDASATNFNIQDCVIYNISFQSININTSLAGTRVFQNNLAIGSTSSFADQLIYRIRPADIFKDNVFVGKTGGSSSLARIFLLESGNYPEANFSNNYFGYYNSAGIRLETLSGANEFTLEGVFKDWTVIGSQNNAFIGFELSPGGQGNFICRNLIFDGLRILGNRTVGMSIRNAYNLLTFRNSIFASLVSGHNQVVGLRVDNTYYLRVILENCDFGVATGSAGTHSTADIQFNAAQGLHEFFGRDLHLGSTTPIQNLQNAVGSSPQSFLRVQRYNNVANDNRSFFRFGTIQTNTSIFNTAAPSEQITPSSSSVKIESSSKLSPVNSGETLTISVRVRKNAAYNGAQPRLLQKAYFPTGVTVDTVLDTMTVAADTWETLTGTTGTSTADGVFIFVVDCDGTAGSIFVDDWEI